MHNKKRLWLPCLLRSACVLLICIAGACGNGTAPILARLCLMAVSLICALVCALIAEELEYKGRHIRKKALARGQNTDKRNAKYYTYSIANKRRFYNGKNKIVQRI